MFQKDFFLPKCHSRNKSFFCVAFENFNFVNYFQVYYREHASKDIY